MISPRALIPSGRRLALPHFSWDRRIPGNLRAWRHLAPRHLLWLVLWAPWWVGNDMPPPDSPRKRQPSVVDAPAGSAGLWLLDQLDDLRFRFGLTWALALILRGAWLGGVASIAWVVLAQLRAVPAPTVYQLLPLVIGGAALGLALRFFHRPTYHQVGQMLDATFALRSRITTAVTGLHVAEARPGGLHELQLADAANALGRSRSRIRREQWLPVREVFLVCIVAVVLLFLLIARRPEGEIAPVSATGIPGFVPVSERLAEAQQEQAAPPEMPDAATLQEVEDISRDSNQARQDLDAIGEALEGSSVTSPASDATEAGDYAEPNDQLSESSGDVAQLPQADRQRLAEDLAEASEQISEENQELAESARNAAEDARSGDDTGALDELGDQIEQTGESVISQEASGGPLTETESQSDAASSTSGGQPSTDGGDQPGSEAARQQGESSGGEPQSGDPGSGMDASGGVESAQPGDGPGQGDGSQGQGSQPGEPGSEAQSGSGDDDSNDGTGPAEPGDRESDGAANDASMSGRPNEEDGEAQGSGAGGGQRDANDPNEPSDIDGGGGDLDNEDQAPQAGDGEAGEPPPSGDGGEGDATTADAPETSASITLEGTSDDRVQAGSDIGSSSVGSGGGVGAAAGDSTAGTSGSAGPDPNAVPEMWREIVEDYFRDGGAP